MLALSKLGSRVEEGRRRIRVVKRKEQRRLLFLNLSWRISCTSPDVLMIKHIGYVPAKRLLSSSEVVRLVTLYACLRDSTLFSEPLKYLINVDGRIFITGLRFEGLSAYPAMEAVSEAMSRSKAFAKFHSDLLVWNEQISKSP